MQNGEKHSLWKKIGILFRDCRNHRDPYGLIGGFYLWHNPAGVSTCPVPVK